jgi:hypothetical protein
MRTEELEIRKEIIKYFSNTLYRNPELLRSLIRELAEHYFSLNEQNYEQCLIRAEKVAEELGDGR